MAHTLRTTSTRLSALVLCVSVSVLGACGKSEPPKSAAPPAAAPPAAAPAAPQAAFRVNRIDLGSAVGADKRVSAPTVAFKPADTIFASVVTDGTGANVALKARWTFEGGQLVNESTQTISPAGPAATEFHISKPDGWPAGKYKVELAANGQPAGAAEFTVVE